MTLSQKRAILKIVSTNKFYTVKSLRSVINILGSLEMMLSKILWNALYTRKNHPVYGAPGKIVLFLF